MNVRRFRLAFECTFKHLLGGNILTAVEFDNATIVERIGISRENALRSKA